MSMAQTAELAVVLKLQDQLSPGISQAAARVRQLEATASGAASGGVSRLKQAAAGMGGALGHAAGQLKMLAAGFGVFAGVAGGLSIAKFFTDGIDRAQEFGTEVRRLAALTGESAQQASTLAAVLEHFGVGADAAQRSVGFLEKNLGLLAARKDGVVKFQQQFGLSLTYSNGQLQNANDLILTASDYFTNKAIPATTKAAALSKLFGRSWQDLIPVLSQGSSRLRDAADEANRLGLALTPQNVADLARLKEQTRAWNTALAGLQLQIGLLLVGPMTDLAKAATDFISDPENRRGILGFFKGMVEAAKGAGSFIGGTVVPTIRGLADAARSFWSQIPAPLQDLLVKGVVADRTISFLFGVSPIKVGLDLLGTGAKDLLGGILGRGGPGNPMYVVAENGLGGAAGGAGGGLLSGVAKVFLVGAAAGVAAELWGQFQQQSAAVQQQGQGLVAQAQQQAPAMTPAEIRAAMQGILAQANDPLNAAALVATNPFNHGLDNLQSTYDALSIQLRQYTADIKDADQTLGRVAGVVTSRSSTTDQHAGKAADDLAQGKSITWLKAILAEAKHEHNPKLIAKTEAEIRALRARQAADHKLALAQAVKADAQRNAKEQAMIGETRTMKSTLAGKIADDKAAVVAAVRSSRPIVNVATSVAVTAGGIRRTVSVSARYGASVGSYGGTHAGGNRL